MALCLMDATNIRNVIVGTLAHNTQTRESYRVTGKDEKAGTVTVSRTIGVEKTAEWYFLDHEHEGGIPSLRSLSVGQKIVNRKTHRIYDVVTVYDEYAVINQTLEISDFEHWEFV
jgi:hypothetical protein